MTKLRQLVTKLRQLRTHQEVVAADLEDPAYRAEWERARFAHEVAMNMIEYRVQHQLSQSQLALQLGMRQPHHGWHDGLTPVP